MFQTFELKTPLAIPIRVEPGFLLIIAYIGYGYGDTVAEQVSAAAVAAFSVLFHELGHAFTARRFGCAPTITLNGTGGETSRGGELTFWRELATIAAGPLTSFLLCGLTFAFVFVYGLARLPFRHAAAIVAAAALQMNLVWGIFNSLPLLPLDGGKVVHVVLARRYGMRALRWMFAWSLAGCAALALWSAARGSWFGAFILGAMALGHMNGFQSMRGMTDAELEPGNAEIIAKASALERGGKVREAYDLLLPLEPVLGHGNRGVLAEFALALGDRAKAIQIGEALFKAMPRDKTSAFLVARAYAVQGDAENAAVWLKRAIGAGLDQAAKRVAAFKEFEPVRDNILIQAVLRPLRKSSRP